MLPQFIVTNRYNLTSGKLVETGKPDKRPFVNAERVSFAKGTSGKTFTITIPAGEARRYIVGARGGQTLTASVSSEKVKVALFEAADITQGVNNMIAKLPKNGDYTIEVRNMETVDIEVTVIIKIQ